MKSHQKLVNLTRAAVFAALICIATTIIPIPIPGGGYANAGDIVLLTCAFFMGPSLGAAAAAIGSCLADLILGYAAYAPGTLIIKGLDALAAAALYRLCRRHMGFVPAACIAGVAGELVMVGGYYFFEYFLRESAEAAAVGVIPNLLQGLVGLAGALLLTPIVQKIADHASAKKSDTGVSK